MTHRPLLVLLLVGAAALGPGVCAALTPTLILAKAKRGEVVFTHGRHVEQYGVACEKCHHNLAAGPQEPTTCKGCHVRSDHRGLCHECHFSDRDDGYQERLESARRRLKKDELPTLYRAFHSLCRNCHVAENSVHKTRAPVECGGCHRAG
ncbi:MAG: cytochrome c3 family protein [Deltaproteobacteria bacterium]|nr:cytochrome c3 family protein [Deltaproteobacteria bacterium]